MNEIEMQVVCIDDLTKEQQVRSLELEVSWYKKQLSIMSDWLNDNKNKSRFNYADVTRRSRSLQATLCEKEKLLLEISNN